tara:strand:+ start:582 stop:812 length:231 start_codon:yes stop_codon:yes gene_type:complete
MNNLKVTSVRYFETSRGLLGYECKTNIKGIEIWNDGLGGITFIRNHTGNKLSREDYEKYTDTYLESLIDIYENLKL